MESQWDIVQTLIQAVETVMDPSATNEHRQKAQQILEDFKENAKGCISCGLQLANANNSPFVRHFGLQIVEHCIKYRWNELEVGERNQLKIATLVFIDTTFKDVLEEAQHIKDGVSRILVELIKREWPQQWTNLFSEFSVLCEKGPKQTEIVLQTMLRLSEDVVCFSNLPADRRSEVQHALNVQMADIFSFFNFNFEKYLSIYRENGGGPDAVIACKLCQATLNTFSGYLDWVAIKHIMETGLIYKLCSLLQDKELCLKAAECLLIIVGRKGQLSERRQLLILFEEVPVNTLLQAASHASAFITESTNLLFLKRVCEIMLELGKQLCALWGSNENVEQPSKFKLYLDACLVFSRHPAQSLQQMIFSLWATFLRHPKISKNVVFLSSLPALVQCCTVCLHKVGYPSKINSPSCEYSRLEFDSDEEFSATLSALRLSVMESVREMTLANPKLMFTAASNWLKDELRRPIVTSHGDQTDCKDICNLSSPSYLSWDACSQFLEDVISKLFLAQGDKPDTKDGVELLHSVLAYESQDPLILSTILSCMSSLFPFLTYSPETVPKVLNKIFGAVAFSLPGQTKSTRSHGVRNVRIHACSIAVKICKLYSALVLPEFESMYNCVKRLDSDKEQLSQMEKTILEEALIIVSNQFHNFDQQSAFLEELLMPAKQLWTSPEFTKAFSSTECFMSYVGLNQPAVEPSSADTCGINRSHITYCINTILAVIKRSQCPQDFSVARKGGFVVSHNGTQIMRNPATHHIVPLLDNLLTFLRSYCCLWQPSYLSLRHQDFVKAYDLMEHECFSMLGCTNTKVLKWPGTAQGGKLPSGVNAMFTGGTSSYTDNTDTLVHRQPLIRMQSFISGVFDNGFHILGSASQHLGLEVYHLSPLIQAINETIVPNLSLLPDHRIKSFIHNFVKPYMQYCPPSLYNNVCIPVISLFCPQMFERLKSKWQVVSERANEEGDDEQQESQEVIEDMILKALTKEYITLLMGILNKKGSAPCYAQEEEAMDDGVDMTVKGAVANNTSFKQLGELGVVVVNTENCYPSIIMCLLAGLSWPNTWASQHSACLLWNVCTQLESRGQMSEESHQHVFMSILSGLQLNGMDPGCQVMLCALAQLYYETFSRKYPILNLVLRKIPDANIQLICELDTRIAQTEKKAATEKRKKKIFKGIVENIIGKNIGERFRRTAQYTILPKLFLEKRRIARPLQDAAAETMGLCELFGSSNDS